MGDSVMLHYFFDHMGSGRICDFSQAANALYQSDSLCAYQIKLVVLYIYTYYIMRVYNYIFRVYMPFAMHLISKFRQLRKI